jgi:hypothetical protein
MFFYLVPAALVELGLSVYALLSGYKYHQHVKTRFEKKRKALQAENEKMAQRIEAQEQDSYDLAMQIKFKGKVLCDMTAKFERVSKELGKANQHCKVLQKELDGVQEQLALKEEDIKKFRHRELGYKKHTASFTFQRLMQDNIIEQQEMETKDLHATIQLLDEGDKLRDERIQELETLVSSKDDTIQFHLSEVQQLTEKTAHQRTALDVAQAMIIEKVAAGKAKDAELERFQDKLTERQYDIDYLNTLLGEKDDALAVEKADVERLNELLQEREDQIAAWRSNTPATIHALQGQIEELGNKYASVKGLYRNQIQAGKQVVAEDEALREENYALMEENDALKEENEALIEDSDALSEENERLARGLREVLAVCENDWWSEENERLARMIKEALGSLEGLKDESIERESERLQVVANESESHDDDIPELEPLVRDDEVVAEDLLKEMNETFARELMEVLGVSKGLKDNEKEREVERFEVVANESEGYDYDDLADLEPLEDDSEEERDESKENGEVGDEESEEGFEMV